MLKQSWIIGGSTYFVRIKRRCSWVWTPQLSASAHKIQRSPPKDVFATQHTSQNPRLAMTQNSLNTRQYRHCERLAKQSGVIFQHKTPLAKPNVVGIAIPTFKITLFA